MPDRVLDPAQATPTPTPTTAAGEGSTADPLPLERPATASADPTLPALPRPTIDAPRIETASALLSDTVERAERELVRPVRVVVPDAGIDAQIVGVGVRRASDELAVPPTHDVAAWYEHGPSPGAAGSAVIAAHVDYDGAPGVFFSLDAVEPGTVITIEYHDGSLARFVAVEVALVAKDDLPIEEIFAQRGEPILTLVTCGGTFDRTVRSYEDNVVVTAVPMAGPGPSLERPAR